MNSTENVYCRFCAEPKSSDKLLNLEVDVTKQDEVMAKLTLLNAMFIDISHRDSLPKTICLVCYDSLNKAYNFFEGVKRAQDVLSSLFTREDKCGAADDDIYEEFVSHDASEDREDVPVKAELDNPNKTEPLDSLPLEAVKQEPKEEKDYEYSSLNVDDILGAALCTLPEQFTSNLTIYAKEVSDAGAGAGAAAGWADYPWVCAFCSIEFLSADMLRAHVQLVHGKCAAWFCADCKLARKDDFTAFVKHVRKHRKSLRNYCQYCNARAESASELKAHVRQHYGQPQPACPRCGEVQPGEEQLAQHLGRFGAAKPARRPRRKPGTPITVEELTCALCHKVYKNPNSLRDHSKLHARDRRRDYTCERCGKMFYNKGTLTSHIMSHDAVRPHACRICSKSFLFPNMLRRHVEMHSGVKPFSCEQCGRCFRLQYQLNAHKIVHTDSMPYVCQYCNKAFRFKQILKNHERQHTGAKPYCCQNCGMEFTNWSNYNKHMKRRHNTDTSKKKITPEGVFPVNPETGQLVRPADPAGTAEWRTSIMLPAKRGKKKLIKEEIFH